MSKLMALAFTLSFTAACTSTTSTPSAPDASAPTTDDGSATDPTDTTLTAFTQAEVQDLFDKRCTKCHDRSNALLDLSSPFTKGTVDIATSKDARRGFCAKSGYGKRIVPGDRAASLLWHKVNGTQDCGNPMPWEKADTKLTATEIERLGLWIDSLMAD